MLTGNNNFSIKNKQRQNAVYIPTYIIGHYNPSVRIIYLVSHTTYAVRGLILYISGEIYSFSGSIKHDELSYQRTDFDKKKFNDLQALFVCKTIHG